MIPPVMAHQLQRGFVDYLDATFPFANEPFRSSFERFAHDGASLMREPYLSVRLPFRKAQDAPACFEAVQLKFTPYVHQRRAYERLACERPRSTLVATGTGSGKTECFLYPILEHCWRHRGQRGVKALIVYPMNALATDQAGRIARLISGNDRLRGNVTAGLYVGGLKPGEGSCAMGEDGVITDRDTMRSNPPDILLTNYKMLDYLLVRPADARIWAENGPETLAFIAVDEMHTFDGAQGTDLACLLRRLKSRLGMARGQVCCVGTSATMGGEGSAQAMRAFARDVFDEEFDEDSVVVEDRLGVAEFFAAADLADEALPDPAALDALDAAALANDRAAYLGQAMAAFFPSLAGRGVDEAATRLELARRLHGSAFLHNVLEVTGGRWFQAADVPARDGWRYRADFSEPADAARAVEAAVALVAHAREGGAGALRPFLNVGAQLWVRELARFVATLGLDEVSFDLGANLDEGRRGRYFPVVNCRECGQTGWAGMLRKNVDGRGEFFKMDGLDAFYRAFFADGAAAAVAYPDPDGSLACRGEGALDCWLCPECGRIEARERGQAGAHACPECGAPALAVKVAALVPERYREGGTPRYACPCCGRSDGCLTLVGQRSTTASEVALTQLFGSDFDDDNHALTFSDNVQDASHRAAFFTGRTWRFTLRSAMRTYLAERGEGQDLRAFRRGLADYWLGRLGREGFVGRFIAPNTTWRRAYEDMLEGGELSRGPAGELLVKSVADRMGYEVLFDLGMRCRVGRTLVRSAAACLEVDPEALGLAVGEAGLLLRDKLGVSAPEEQVGRALAALLDALRQSGALAAPDVYDSFVAVEGNRKRYARKMHGNYPSDRNTMPRFVRLDGRAGEGVMACGDDVLTSAVMRELGGLVREGEAAEAVESLLRAALHVGLLASAGFDASRGWLGLSEDALRVTGACTRFECDCCGAAFVHASANASLWEGACCPTGPCPGHLRRAAQDCQGLDYYGRLYDRGDCVRVRAHEHTGLLARPLREEVERQFKATGDEAREWYPNVLSCTPTLEMGIDIGDLSALVLCSMPPGQAQFLQRVGRAGRRDGNSVAAVVAEASPHGAYFYGEPYEMIQGQVEAPRVFLHAAAVLERQFLAFCMDRWVRDASQGAEVPKKMGVCLGNMRPDRRDQGKFPFNYLGYAAGRSEGLFGDFLALFAGQLDSDEEAVRELRGFVMGADPSSALTDRTMSARVLHAFEVRAGELAGARDRAKELRRQIDKLKAGPQDSSFAEQIKRLEVEKAAAGDVVRSIADEDVYGFLTREGLLPNYAFPEDGVHLRVVMRRKLDEEEQGEGQEGQPPAPARRRRTQRMVQEYSRAASAAMGDFAPGNTFYAGGRHFKVDQVDMGTAEFELWRLCPSCNHAERVSADTPARACPKCGDVGWEDQGQLRRMLRLSGVVSNSDYRESLCSDETDRRVSERYARRLLVDVDPDEVLRAYRIRREGYEFGYEYVRRAAMREINFGPAGVEQGQKSVIAGDECVRKGFKVCTACGKLELDENRGVEHDWACPVKTGAMPAEGAVEECLFLYRQFETEALRLTIPEVTLPGDESQMAQTFTALVMLGLRKKFGNVDHLATVVSEEPIAQSEFRTRYLVVYDSVPGGTGYLKQLVADDHALREVLELARAALEACSCNLDPQRDGCYRCLYAYRQSRELGNISRRRALAMLADLLDPANETVAAEGISDVQTSVLIESELERRFVQTLGMLSAPDGSRFAVEGDVVRGKEGWRLHAGGMEWEVEPQVSLDGGEGVAVPCKPDFVLRPVGAQTAAGHLPVAVFTDGYAYHEGIADDDTAKRQAVRRSGRFRVWSLSYDDVSSLVDPVHAGDYHLHALDPGGLPFLAMYRLALGQRPGLGDALKGGPLVLLGAYLATPDAEAAFADEARAFALGMTSSMQPADAPAVLARAREAWEALGGPGAGPSEPAQPFVTDWRPAGSRRLCVCGFSEQRGEQIVPALVAELDDAGNHDDLYKKAWTSFWHLWDLMQFEPGFAAVSRGGLAGQAYTAFWGGAADGRQPDASQAAEGGTLTAWAGLLSPDFLEENALSAQTAAFMRLLAERGVAPDGLEVGYEADSGDMAELAWPARRTCYLTAADADCRQAFEADGWTVMLEGQDNDAAIAALMEG